MEKELQLCIALLNRTCSKSEIINLVGSVDKQKFLSIAVEFPLETLIKSCEYYKLVSLTNLIKREMFFITIKNRLLYKFLLNLATAFNLKKIDFIVLKSFAYPELIKTRRTSDIDFLIKSQSLNKCLNTLRSLGFVKSEINIEQYFKKFSHHLPMSLKFSFDIKVEPHWQLAPKYSPFCIDNNLLWQKSRKQHLGNCNVRVLSDEHNLIHLSIHALYQPALSTPLRDIYIISRIIAERRINWDFLVKDAHAWKANNFVYFSLFLAKKYFGAKIPSSVLLNFKKRGFQYFMIRLMLLKKLNFLRKKRYAIDDFLYELMFADFQDKINLIKRVFYAIKHKQH